MDWSNSVDLLRLTTVVMSDTPPPTVDAVYLFGHTPDNELSILERGARLWKNKRTSQLYLCGGGPYRAPNVPLDTPIAYAGFFAWKAWLVRHGVKSSDIHAIERPRLSHTGTEAARLIALAKEKKWETLCIVACPFHMLRAFANTVFEIEKIYPQLRMWAQVGTPLPWNEEVVSSQGTVRGTRLGAAIDGEWDRLNRWYAEGEMASCQEAIQYIMRRDSDVPCKERIG